MKARIKATGEEVDVSSVIIMNDDGRYYEFHAAEIDIVPEDSANLNELRNKAAIAAMQAIVSNNETFLAAMNAGKRRDIPSDKAVVVAAVEMADNLIEELKCSSADEVAGNKDKKWAMSVLDFKITNCALSIRTMNLLKSAGIDTIGELLGLSKYDLLKNVNFGKKSVGEIEDFLAGIGLKLKGE